MKAQVKQIKTLSGETKYIVADINGKRIFLKAWKSKQTAFKKLKELQG